MTHDHPNTLLILQCWQAVADSDVETLRAIWSNDIVWHVAVDNPWRGDHKGIDAVLEYLAQVGEMGETYDTKLEAVMANDRLGFLMCHVSSKRGMRVLEHDQVLLGRFDGGQLTEAWSFSLDPEAVSRYWS